jgi:hypothetical protein
VSLVAAAGLALLLAGCGAPASTGASTGSPSTNGRVRTPQERAAAFTLNAEGVRALGYRADWTGFPFVNPGARIAIVDAAADPVAVLESGGNISLLERNTGALIATTAVGTSLTKFTGVTRVPAGVVVVSESEAFTIAPQTGNLNNREAFEQVVNTRPLTLGSTLILGTARGQVLAHTLGRAIKAWGYATTASFSVAPTTVGEGLIGAVSDAGEVIFLTTGGSLTGRGRTFAPPAGIVGGDSLLYVASRDQSLYAFRSDGAIAWRLRTNAPFAHAPMLVNGALLVTVPGTGLSSIDPATGAIRWSAKDVSGDVVGQRDGRLLVWNGSALMLLDPARGDIIQQADMPGVRAVTTDRPADGDLYLSTQSGVLVRLTPRT